MASPYKANDTVNTAELSDPVTLVVWGQIYVAADRPLSLLRARDVPPAVRAMPALGTAPTAAGPALPVVSGRFGRRLGFFARFGPHLLR